MVDCRIKVWVTQGKTPKGRKKLTTTNNFGIKKHIVHVKEVEVGDLKSALKDTYFLLPTLI